MDNEGAIDNNNTDVGLTSVEDKTMCIEVFPLNHCIPSSRQIVISRLNPLIVEARYLNPNLLPNQNVLIGKYRIGNVSQMEPQKLRLKLRMNTHGIFNIAHAQLMEEYEKEVEVTVVDDDNSQNEKMPVSPNLDEVHCENGDSGNAGENQDSKDVEMPNAEKPKATKKVMKKKKFTKYHDLGIDVENMQLDNKQLMDFTELEVCVIKQNVNFM